MHTFTLSGRDVLLRLTPVVSVAVVVETLLVANTASWLVGELMGWPQALLLLSVVLATLTAPFALWYPRAQGWEVLWLGLATVAALVLGHWWV